MEKIHLIITMYYIWNVIIQCIIFKLILNEIKDLKSKFNS